MKYSFANERFALILSIFAAVSASFAHAEAVDVMYDCMIQPSSVVNVGSEATGILEKLLVDRGDYVRKGQVIAKLNSGVEHAAVESRKVRYEYAVRDLQRKAELYTKRFIPAADVDEAETMLKIAQRDYEEAKEVLERRTIRSPVDGVVVQRLMEAGARVEVEPIMRLAQVSPLYAEVIAPASILGTVRPGDKVAVRPEVPTGRDRYVGRVKVVDSVVDAASGTVGIRIQIDNKDRSLPAGLKCTVEFLKKRKVRKSSRRSAAASPAKKSRP